MAGSSDIFSRWGSQRNVDFKKLLILQSFSSGRDTRSRRWCKIIIWGIQIGFGLKLFLLCISFRVLRITPLETIASTTVLRTTIFSAEYFKILPKKRRTLEVLLGWPIDPFSLLVFVFFWAGRTKAGVVPGSFKLFNHRLRFPSLRILSVLLIQ